jgi:hypothetical protein
VNRGAGDRGVRVLDRGDVVRGDQRVVHRAGPGRVGLPRPAALRPGIAARVGVAPNAIYTYFPDKAAVVKALVVVAVLATDVVFAVDSVPAVYGITGDPYLVFATNAFALLGLRALYFVLEGALSKLVHLGYGLAAILGFIGTKLVLHWAHGCGRACRRSPPCCPSGSSWPSSPWSPRPASTRPAPTGAARNTPSTKPAT